MKARWKGVIAAVTVAGLLAIAFVAFFYGINLDDGMVIRSVTKKGALWVGMDGNPRNVYREPLWHFFSGAAFILGMLWVLVASAMGPVGYVLGYLWERWRETPRSA